MGSPRIIIDETFIKTMFSRARRLVAFLTWFFFFYRVVGANCPGSGSMCMCKQYSFYNLQAPNQDRHISYMAQYREQKLNIISILMTLHFKSMASPIHFT